MMKINNSSSTPSEPERIACILRYDGGSGKRCHTYTSDAASPFIGSKMQKASDNPFRLGSYYAQRAAPPREKNSCKFRCDRGSAKRCHTYTSDAALPFIGRWLARYMEAGVQQPARRAARLQATSDEGRKEGEKGPSRRGISQNGLLHPHQGSGYGCDVYARRPST